MRREDYERKMTNDQIAEVIAKMEQLSTFFSDISKVVQLFADTGKETIQTRRSVAQARTALDFGEFMTRLKAAHPAAAERLGKAEVLKFEIGRLHIRFPDDHKRAAFTLYKHSVEELSKELYKTPCKILIRQSPQPYEDF